MALRFLFLTATRTGEVLGARWEEVDLEAREWTIAGERMKAGRTHRVPLSRAALAVLEDAARWCPGGKCRGLIFPSPRSRSRELSRPTLWKGYRTLGLPGVPHGLRSTFRDWCAETGVRQEVAERALAHAVRNPTEAAYHRTTLYVERQKVMEDWGQYITRKRG